MICIGSYSYGKLGTGVWAIELAESFPKATIIGADVTVTEPNIPLPDNVSFALADVNKSLPFADDFFDLVHMRLLIGGITDWHHSLQEVIRVLRPGGLIYSVEVIFPWPILGISEHDSSSVARGYWEFASTFARGAKATGMDVDAGEVTIPQIMGNHHALHGMQTQTSYMPYWAWSSDPHLKRAGEIGLPQAKEIPDTIKAVMMSGHPDMTEDTFEKLKQGFLDDLGRPGATTGARLWHNWAFKKA